MQRVSKGRGAAKKVAAPKAKAGAPEVEMHELYGGKVLVKFYVKSHQYWVSTDGGKNFSRKSGVTSIIGIKDKSTPLGSWQQGLTLDFLLAQIAAGVKIDEEKAIAAVVQHEVERDEAADIGKEIHAWCEAYIRHELKQKGFESLPEIPNFPEAVTGVNAFMEWLKKHKVKFVSTETVVYSKKHDYIGQEDVTFIADGLYCDADFKSSNGLYNGVRMQTAAYAEAREEMGGKKSEGRWAIRLNKYTEAEYYKREERKKMIRASIARFKGKEPSTFPIKPYVVFEAAFLDNDRRARARDFDAFLTCQKLTEWNKATDPYITKGTIEDTAY